VSVVEWKEGPAGHGMTLYLICGQANKDSVDLVSDARSPLAVVAVVAVFAVVAVVWASGPVLRLSK